MENDKFVDTCLDDYMVYLRKILKEKLIKKMPTEDGDYIETLDVQLNFSDYDYCLVMKVVAEDIEFYCGWKFGDGVESVNGVHVPV